MAAILSRGRGVSWISNNQLPNANISQPQYVRATLTISIGFTLSCHDHFMKWKHFPRYWPFVRGIHRWPVNSPHKGQWHRALMYSLICTWINSWVNNHKAGDLRRHRPHCDVIVMHGTQNKIIAFSWMKIFIYQCKFHWSLIIMVQLTNQSAWVQVRCWCLFSTKPLPKPMMTKFNKAYMHHINTWTRDLIVYFE